MKQQFHEAFDREDIVAGSSDRALGLVFAAAFGLLAAYGAWHQSSYWWLGAGGAGGFLAVALVKPHWLAPLNRFWTRFGLVLHRIMSPLALGILFFVFVTPWGLAMRLCGMDPMRRKPAPPGGSYWIKRGFSESADSMKNQF